MLQVVAPRIQPVPVEQFRMGPGFDDAPGLHDQDTVCIAGRT